jgi:hypothetical protein
MDVSEEVETGRPSSRQRRSRIMLIVFAVLGAIVLLGRLAPTLLEIIPR